MVNEGQQRCSPEDVDGFFHGHGEQRLEALMIDQQRVKELGIFRQRAGDENEKLFVHRTAADEHVLEIGNDLVALLVNGSRR